jgi:dCTP deaminase
VATLSGKEIAFRREMEQIKIEPWNPAMLNPNSYNLSLGPKLLLYNHGYLEHLRQTQDHERWPFQPPQYTENTKPEILDMAVEAQVNEILIPPEGIILWPNVLYLGSTVEYTETHNFVPIIEGRSSVARLGLCVHVTAGFGDCGFCGHWTLEMTVVEPLRIYAGVALCQIAYTELVGTPSDYKGKYQNQSPDPKPSRLFTELAWVKEQQRPSS